MPRQSTLGVEDPLVVANDGAYNYFVSARNYDSVRGLARKCLGGGIVDKALRPLNTFRLDQKVQAVDSPELYAAEDEWAEQGVVADGPAVLRGKDLARQILKNFNQIDKGGEAS